MKKNIHYLLLSCAVLFFLACTKKNNDAVTPKPAITSDANLRVTTPSLRFDGHYKNGNTKEDSFFVRYYPNEGTRRPLIITFHGGGFTMGALKQFELNLNIGVYTNLITRDHLDNNGFAYASANYRLLSTGDGIDLKESLGDCKAFVEYMRDNADKYNIDPNKIILMGYSAGASASLWLGLQNNFIQDVTIKGIIAYDPQASMNLLEWRNQIFAPANSTANYDMYTTPAFLVESKLWYYSSTNQAVINDYSNSHQLSLFNLFDYADPEVYLVCDGQANDVRHHPAHIWALKSHSTTAGHIATIQFNQVPAYINPNFESIMQFCVRKFQ